MTSLDTAERFALVTLRDMIANLQAHIDYRAAEIAAPRITAVEESVTARVAAAEGERDQWQERFEDLQQELGRQLTVLERQRDRLRAEVAELREALKGSQAGSGAVSSLAYRDDPDRPPACA
jgi:chromosome segregation ATPase